MDGQNQAFLTNPETYLETHSKVCYGNKIADQKDDINRIEKNTLPVKQEFAPAVEFDLVRNKLGYIDLKMLGAVGTYGKTWRHGRPIVGNYIPFLGMTKEEDSSKFGKINLSRVATDYVFTFSFTGCNFVVTKKGGDTWVYHEPTKDTWLGDRNARYADELVVATIGPAYDDLHSGGFGCLVRDKATRTRWTAYVQRPDGITMKKANLTKTIIDC